MIRIVLGIVALLLVTAVLVLAVTRRRYEVTASTLIARPPAEVWAVLTQTDAYPTWNPFIRRLEGRLVEGDRIRIEVGSGDTQTTFRPILLEVAPGRALRWRGSLGPGGLFDGDHRFALVAEGSGTRFVQTERFSGLLVGSLTQGFVTGLEADFQTMNRALKERVERSSQ